MTDRMQRRWKTATEEQKESVLKSIPLGRLSSVDDQANVIAFLASDDASYITGASLLVDWGVMAGELSRPANPLQDSD